MRADTFTTTPEDAARVEAHQHSREPRLPDVYAEDLPPLPEHVGWHAPGCWACDLRRTVDAARGGAS